ncbi:unnamed protein product [Prunus armeniaca]
MDGGGGGATIGKVWPEPVETAGGSGAFRSGFWVVQDRGFTTSRTGPVSKAGVVGCGGGVAVSVRVNSDEGESSREREKTDGREREKPEAFLTFKKYKSHVEKESGSTIKCLRIDHGGKKIPKKIWPKAVNWTIHVLNRSPTLAVKNKTPKEAWSGFKPAVDHFREFRCVSHVHVSDCKRTKLNEKSVRCVLLGTDNNKEPDANARNRDDAETEGFNGTDEGNMSNLGDSGEVPSLRSREQRQKKQLS